MFSQTWQKFFLSVTSTTLVALGLPTFSANAVTFRFDGERIKGTYSINDDIYSAWLSAITNPQYDQTGWSDYTIYREITDFTMFLDGQDAGYRLNPNRNQFHAYGSTNRDDQTAYYDYFDLIIQSQSGQNGNDFYVAFDNLEGYGEIEGRPRATDCIIPGKSCSASAGFTTSFNEKVTHSVVTGSSKLVPISAQQVGNSLMFENAQSGFWFATPSKDSFELEMTGDAKLNQISNFLAGLDDGSLFSISVGDTNLGEFQSGQDIDFVKLLGEGVSKFKVTSNQGFTVNNFKVLSSAAQTYSSKFIFNTDTASFKITSLDGTEPEPQPKPVPEPTSALALLIFGGAWMLKRQNSSAAKV